jgi:putative chitinase
MCIARSVGEGGANRFEDVKVVQVLLNLNGARPQLAVDGRYGSSSRAAIESFQRSAMGAAAADGLIAPDGATLKRLLAGIPAELSEMKLSAIMPHARREHVTRFYPALLPSMIAHDIDTPLRQAHFLAQIGHESGSLRYTEEIASGEAYEGRHDLGNTQPGDGRRFKGRGLIQLTGRANYEKYGAARGIDVTQGDNPGRVATDPGLAVDVACWFWKDRGLNALADGDDARSVTRRINGGLNGLDDRLAYLARSKAFLKIG